MTRDRIYKQEAFIVDMQIEFNKRLKAMECGRYDYAIYNNISCSVIDNFFSDEVNISIRDIMKILDGVGIEIKLSDKKKLPIKDDEFFNKSVETDLMVNNHMRSIS